MVRVRVRVRVGVRVRVRVSLRSMWEGHTPPRADSEGSADERGLVRGLPGRGELLEGLQLAVEEWEEEGADHAEDPDEVV